MKERHLNTVCKEANCPNRMECYSKRTSTFMILGSICSRGCRFCNVAGGTPTPVDYDEPHKVAMAIHDLGLKFAVVTSVTRDDLADGGSGIFAELIREVHALDPPVQIEVLIPDFQGSREDLQRVVDAGPEIINHNVETVPDLYAQARPEADYNQSLELLSRVKAMNPGIKTKSGIMLGLGETREQVLGVLRDLRAMDVDFLTIGQYLQPSKEHLSIKAYIHPDEFARYKEEALAMGFKGVASGPFVRSSYNAAEMLEQLEKRFS